MLLVLLSFAQSPLAAAEPRHSARSTAAPTPLQDDAALHDIQFEGDSRGWAVGDHGVIWHTTDGGHSWSLLPSPVGCPLRSLCFLTDRVGWVAGGGTLPYTGVGYGVLLFTRDGGQTWESLAPRKLPRLAHVQFFGLEQGIAVGDATPEFPSGVLATVDGGRNWQPVEAPPQSGWRAAHFASPSTGIVAGIQGRVRLAGNDQLVAPQIGELGLRGLRGVTLAANRTGWLVGDGGLVLHTTSSGAVWQSPPTPLPQRLADAVDFHAVAARGDSVWVAGRPGSLIWHSPDGGHTWIRQRTGQTAPVYRLHFHNARVGWACGAFGMILKTTTGGQTWQPLRGGGRHAALLSIAPRPSHVPFTLLAKEAGELGYRTAVVIPARQDTGPDGYRSQADDLRLHEAVTATGGSAAHIGWRFPVGIPGLAHNRQRLIAEWNSRTEGRLRDTFLGALVSEIRTWRPSVVTLRQPAADDVPGQVVHEAALQAIRLAGDATGFIEHTELAGLEPWQVRKVFIQLPDNSTGDVHILPDEHLPRSNRTVRDGAAAGYSLLLPRTEWASHTTARAAWRLHADRHAGTTPPPGHGADFFRGLVIPTGSPARRALLPVDEDSLARSQALARRQRNVLAIARQYGDRPRHAAQMVAHLEQVTRGLSRQRAALQLARLAEGCRERSQWDLVEATLVELVEKYPEQPVALEAMHWLFCFWSGAEPAWQRLRAQGASRETLASNNQLITESIERAIRQSRTEPAARSGETPDYSADPLSLVEHGGQLRVGPGQNWQVETVRNWQDQALRMAGLVRRRSPVFYRTPQMQFPLASLMRTRGVYRMADSVFRRYRHTAGGALWQQTAEAEVWLSQPVSEPPRPVYPCRATAFRPVLDGVLSDACWVNAQAMRLSPAGDEPPAAEEAAANRSGVVQTSGTGNSAEQNTNFAFAMLSYDAEYLYVALSIPRSPAVRADLPADTGRTHDADLTGFDRIQLPLDIDRDYATWYELEIDQRGFTADRCWGDQAWNPRWFVAAAGDEHYWRVEAAIPFSELMPQAPQRKAVWALGLVRTIPAVGIESWTQPAAARPRPETFGLLRFD